MKHYPRLHDTYIARSVITSVLLTWGVLLGLDLILAFAGEADDIGKGAYTVNHAIAATGLTIPWRAYNLFPTAAVIGALLGLGQLAASSELTALRALGLSRRRLSVSVALALALLTGLMVVNGETLGPWGQKRADSLKASAKSNDMIVAQYSGLWAREGDTFLNAQTGHERDNGNGRYLELQGVRLYEFYRDGRLESIARAGTAEHHAGGWLLHDVKRTWFDSRSVTETEALEERWASKLDEAALAASISSPRYLPATELSQGIDYRKRNGLDASEYEEHYWGRWFYPINVLALCLAAVPFAFGSLRSGGLGKRLFIGIVFALGFWLLQTQFVKLAGVYKFDYRVAYLVPPLIMLAVSAALFRRRSG